MGVLAMRTGVGADWSVTRADEPDGCMGSELRVAASFSCISCEFEAAVATFDAFTAVSACQESHRQGQGIRTASCHAGSSKAGAVQATKSTAGICCKQMHTTSE